MIAAAVLLLAFLAWRRYRIARRQLDELRLLVELARDLVRGRSSL